QGIDAFFMEDGFYDNVADALADAENAFYLDLSLQSPKLRAIPEDVYKLTNLKYLELGYNQIGSVDEGILKLTSLEILGLDGNKYLKVFPWI
ncbi:MAG: leucine-rich repeat domain-containing protein, partial [Flavobacteriales bacterium]|nr:leucine-rich repeat domain-containing protein [Flavobacteriales bacterium]